MHHYGILEFKYSKCSSIRQKVTFQIGHAGLNRVYSKFVDVTFDTVATAPNYDEMYKTINEEIENSNVPKPVLVSWLTPQDRRIAAKKRLPAINTINDIAQMNEIQYPNPEYDFFHHNNIKNVDLATEASTSSKRTRRKK